MASALIAPLAVAGAVVADPGDADPDGGVTTTEVTTSTSEVTTPTTEVTTTTEAAPPDDDTTGDDTTTTTVGETDDTESTVGEEPVVESSAVPVLDMSGTGDLMLMSAPLAAPVPAPTCTVSMPVRLDSTIGARCVKTRLRQLGLYDGPINDVFEWHAAYVLGNLQEDLGFTRTSVGDRATLEAMGIWSNPATTCSVSYPVRLGSSLGARCVKSRLRQLGVYDGPINDVFEWHAAYVLGNLQEALGFTRTSVADAATLEAMGIWSVPARTCSVPYPVRLDSSLGARCVKTRLRQLGVYDGPINDTFEWHAAYVLGNLQENFGFTRTSVGDAVTLGAIGIWSVPASTCSVMFEVRLDSVAGARCVKTRLRQLGVYDGPINDTFEWHAAYVLGNLQENFGFTRTSVADEATLRAIGIWAQPPAPSCKVGVELHDGQTSNDVLCLERRLAEIGIFTGTPDTRFDSATLGAVQQYQRAKGLPETGRASTAVLSSLNIFDAALGNPLPDNSGSGRRIVYSRSQQRLWAVDANGTVVKTHRVSGRLHEPYAGTYSVFSRSLHTFASNNPSIKWMYMVRFTKGFQGGNIGFHEIPNQYGRPLQTVEQLGLPLSGGCVRQSTPDAIWVWNWAPVGTRVVVL